MDKEILEKMVGDGLSTYVIARNLGKGPSTIRYWLLKHNLGTKRIFKCGDCGDLDPLHFFVGRYSQCKKCRRKWQNESNRKRKRILVEYKGGKCTKCGYNKCMAALDFHHEDPSGKDPNWERMRNWSPVRVKKELDKCILVCRNCHSEIHYAQEIIQSVA